MLRLTVLLGVFSLASADSFTVQTYPNPRSGEYKKCNMRSMSNVLTEGDRYRMQSALTTLSQRSSQQTGTFCGRRGIDAMLALTEKASQQFADQLLAKWNTDGQCKNVALFVLSEIDKQMYLAVDRNAAISQDQFRAALAPYQNELQQGGYSSVMAKVFKDLGTNLWQSNSNSHPAGPNVPTQGVATAILSFSLIIILCVLF